MKKVKKISGVFLILMLGVSLSSCNNDGNSESNTKDTDKVKVENRANNQTSKADNEDEVVEDFDIRTLDARKSFEEFWEHATNLNVKELGKYTDELRGTEYESFNLEEYPDEIKKMFEIVKGLHEDSTMTYKSGRIEEGANTGTLVYTYIGKDPEEYNAYLEKNYSPEELMYGDEEASDIIKKINDSGIKTIETDYNVDMHYDEANDIWKVDKVVSKDLGEFKILDEE